MGRVVSSVGVLAGAWLAAFPAVAQSNLHEYEGTWIWDRNLYVSPPNEPPVMHMMAETLSVSRDDGRRYTAHVTETYDNGAVVGFDENFDEDGLNHTVVRDGRPLAMRMSLMEDGARHVVGSAAGMVQDSVCRVSDSGLTLTCSGTHRALDGSLGDFACIYHRDGHVWPMS